MDQTKEYQESQNKYFDSCLSSIREKYQKSDLEQRAILIANLERLASADLMVAPDVNLAVELVKMAQNAINGYHTDGKKSVTELSILSEHLTTLEDQIGRLNFGVKERVISHNARLMYKS